MRSDLYDYSDAYILLKRKMNDRAVANTDTDQKDAALKNKALFRSCITKINNTLIENAKVLDIVMVLVIETKSMMMLTML